MTYILQENHVLCKYYEDEDKRGGTKSNQKKEKGREENWEVEERTEEQCKRESQEVEKRMERTTRE